MDKKISEAKKKFIVEFMDMKYPLFDIPVAGCSMFLGVTLDVETDMLYAGSVTNAGAMREFSVSIDYDFSLDQNLEELYEEIISKIMV